MALNSIAESELLYDMLPDFSQIFVCRDAAPQITSMFCLISGHDLIFDISTFIANNRLLSWMFPTVQPQWLMYNVCDEMRHVKDMILNKSCTLFGSLAINWAELCFHYREITDARIRSNRKPMPAFKCEHLIDDDIGYITVLFRHCKLELTPERQSLFCAALESDSQANTFASREIIAKKIVEINREMIAEADRYMSYYNLPAWGEQMNLENTVTGYQES